MIWYKEKNDKEIALKFMINRNKVVIGNIVAPNGGIIESLDLNTIKEMKEYLEKIKDKIYLIKVA